MCITHYRLSIPADLRQQASRSGARRVLRNGAERMDGGGGGDKK